MAKKSPAELYEEREKRFRDAIELKVPDRVPVVLTSNYMPVRFVEGLTVADSYYRPAVWRKATVKTFKELEPDIQSAQAGGPGDALAALSPLLFKWAGDGLGPNVMHQFLEGQPLKPEEYDLFLADPGDYTLRYYLPRVWKTMAPLAKLPPLQSLLGSNTLASRSAVFGDPEVMSAFAALFKAGKAQAKFAKAAGNIEEDLALAGFPAMSQGGGAAPFDVVSDYLRGMAGTMTDMYRYPEKLSRTCDYILDNSISERHDGLKVQTRQSQTYLLRPPPRLLTASWRSNSSRPSTGQPLRNWSSPSPTPVWSTSRFTRGTGKRGSNTCSNFPKARL